MVHAIINDGSFDGEICAEIDLPPGVAFERGVEARQARYLTIVGAAGVGLAGWVFRPFTDRGLGGGPVEGAVWRQ